MILFDRRKSTVTGRVHPTRASAPVEVASGVQNDGRGDSYGESRTARQQVEEWLDAVALCFGLPAQRPDHPARHRWFEY